jgi:hypothetical protein
MATPGTARYRDRYPGQGAVALLCEGDVAGYESDLLRRWTAQLGGRRLVDVWPCGTATAIYGVADALGRSCPLVVVEDRDYRSEETARQECEHKRKRREERGVNALGWVCWRRNEVENYFLDSAILYPAMARAFGTEVDQVDRRLQHLIGVLGVDQAAQSVLYAARHPWSDAELPGRLPAGLPRAEARPRWDPQSHTVVAPERGKVEGSLIQVIGTANRTADSMKQVLDADALLARFGSLSDQWTGLTLDDNAWRVDWSGKDVLAHLRQWLAADFGWLDKQSGAREKVDWDDLAGSQRHEWDRRIEWAIQPHLVESLLGSLRAGTGSEARNEWDAVLTTCVGA